jgi:hypothetical protein
MTEQNNLAPRRDPAPGRACGGSTGGVYPSIRHIYARHKTHDEIHAQCAAQGLDLADHLYSTGESDFIKVEGGGAWALYSIVNGQFFGKTPTGLEFSSRSTDHEGEAWFQQLLAFFYVEKESEAHRV